jgi:lipoxygenase
VKGLTFSGKTLFSVMHAVVPSIQTLAIDKDLGFPYFTAIDSLFNEGLHLPNIKTGIFQNIIPRLIKFVDDIQRDVLLFETPRVFDSNHNVPFVSIMFFEEF